MSNSSNVIGINFGTMYTSIAYMNKDGQTDCLANEEGDRQIASVLAFREIEGKTEEVAGSQAKSGIARYPTATVANFRANVGQCYTDAVNLAGSAATVVDKDGQPGYDICFPGGNTVPFTASEISTKYLCHIRESASLFLGTTVNSAVMAVPSYFTEKQRSDLIAAAKEAGINVVQLVHESAAAALAYDIGQQSAQDETIVVCDLGGHSFDVTVLTVRSGIYSILATAHDTKLGGSSFDDRLVNHFAAEFQKKSKIDITNNAKALVKLRAQVEVTKKNLSREKTAPAFVESLAEGVDFQSSLTRMRFEMMSKDVFAKLQDVILEVLKKADLDPSEIDQVILAGGSARVPKFKVKVQEIFNAKNTKIRDELETDEVVARGCAIQGSLVADVEQEDIEASIHPVVTLAPSTSKAIGVLNAEGQFLTVIPRGTALPARRVFEFSNAIDDQTHAYLALHEGDHTIEKTEIPAEPVEVEDDEEPYEMEPEIVTKVVIKPAAKLIEASLPLENGKKAKTSKIEVQVTIDKDRKLILVLREKGGSNVVKAEVSGQ